MEKVYIQLNLPNILTIAIIVFVVYTFGGSAVALAQKFAPTSQNNAAA